MIYPERQFTLTTSGMLVADASSLGWPPGQYYSTLSVDAREYRALYTLAHVEKSEGDVQHWDYRPTSGKGPHVRVFND